MNNPNENVNQQTGVSTPSVAPVNNAGTSTQVVQPTVTTVAQNVQTSVAAVVPTTTVVQNVQPTGTSVSPATVGPTVPTANVSSATVDKTAPVVPQQDRVQLIDDKPKLHAVIGTSGTVTTSQQSQSENVQSVSANDESQNEQIQSKGGKFRTFFLFVLFGGLFAMVIYLPDISNYIETQKYLKNQPVEEKITTGTLKCSIESSTENLDYSQSLNFSFLDNELTNLTYVTKTRGSMGLDDEELDGLKAECDQLVMYADKLSGIDVSCELINGTLTRKQVFDYSSVVVDDAITAYIEAGGSYPDYEIMESIDNIERDMNASGYTCERVK